MDYVGLAARVLVAAVLLHAALGKARSRRARADLADTLRAVPAVGVRAAAAAHVLIAAEASIAAAALVPTTARVGSALAAALLAGFAGGTGWLLHRRVGAACNCFGGTGAALRRDHVVRNAALAAVAVLAAVAEPAPGPDPAGAVTAAAAGYVLALLVTRWDDLAGLVAGPAPVRSHPSARVRTEE
jgi:hypothetical protein